ncbi:MAG TPA: hypothetical protein VJ913_03230 [Actinomycetota bacterium]|nr:hypothetical protein [Actinomycetota bacterium]
MPDRDERGASRDDGRRDLRCPVCGAGVLRDIAYDENPTEPSGIKQAPESLEVLTFTCGHEVEAHRLDEAGRNDPNVERRGSEETVGDVGLT